MENNKKKSIAVWFIQADQDEVKDFSSMKFALFVKAAYYEKLDKLKHKRLVAERCGHQ